MVEVLMATPMDQRDGVTAVTVTRYPLAPRKRKRRGVGRGRARRGAVGVRRHAVTAVIATRAAQPAVLRVLELRVPFCGRGPSRCARRFVIPAVVSTRPSAADFRCLQRPLFGQRRQPRRFE
jgi:hypothetical protein